MPESQSLPARNDLESRLSGNTLLVGVAYKDRLLS